MPLNNDVQINSFPFISSLIQTNGCLNKRAFNIFVFIFTEASGLSKLYFKNATDCLFQLQHKSTAPTSPIFSSFLVLLLLLLSSSFNVSSMEISCAFAFVDDFFIHPVTAVSTDIICIHVKQSFLSILLIYIFYISHVLFLHIHMHYMHFHPFCMFFSNRRIYGHFFDF